MNRRHQRIDLDLWRVMVTFREDGVGRYTCYWEVGSSLVSVNYPVNDVGQRGKFIVHKASGAWIAFEMRDDEDDEAPLDNFFPAHSREAACAGYLNLILDVHLSTVRMELNETLREFR